MRLEWEKGPFMRTLEQEVRGAETRAMRLLFCVETGKGGAEDEQALGFIGKL